MPQKLYKCATLRCTHTTRTPHTTCDICRAHQRRSRNRRYAARAGNKCCPICNTPTDGHHVYCESHRSQLAQYAKAKYHKDKYKNLDDVLHHLGRAYGIIVQTVEYGTDYVPDDAQRALRVVTALLLCVKNKLTEYKENQPELSVRVMYRRIKKEE